MAIKHFYNWKPDTCGCNIKDAWECDDDGNNDKLLGYGGQVNEKCEDHKDVPDDELYGVIKVECYEKNLINTVMLGLTGKDFGFHEEVIEKDKKIMKLKEGVSFGWHFTGKNKNRKLDFSIEGATPSQTKDVRNEIDEQLKLWKSNPI